MIVAVIPAAGHSTRMGRPKLSLPLGGKTVLEHVIAALRAGGVERVLVVIGPHVADLAPIAEKAGAEVCLLERETAEMRETIDAGLRWFEQRHAMRDDDSWLLVPADHPALDGQIVARLLEVSAREPNATIFIPTHAGKRGHPTLIAWKHVAGMRALPAGQGLNVYLRGLPDETCEVPVESRSVVLDLDTPEDYERLRKGMGNMGSEVTSLRSAWARIERWLKSHAPGILADMRPGASVADIHATEGQLGCIFPETVREWFTIHNGSESCALLEYWDLYSLAEIVTAWQSLKGISDRGFFDEVSSDPVGPIRTEWWNPAWIPLTGEPGGDHLCLDLAPVEGGCVGQIISWVHDDSVREVVAPTFPAWFEQLADGLERGAYKVDREGVLVRIGGPEDVADI